MGFQDEEEVPMQEEDVSDEKRLFENHLSFEEMVLGVKEGRYF